MRPAPRSWAGAGGVGMTAAIGAVTACVVLVLALATTGDYAPFAPGAAVSDNAAPALAALRHLDLSAFVAHQPALGLTSLLLRLPFVALARLGGGGLLAEYRAGALPCVLALVPVAVHVARALDRRGVPSPLCLGAAIVLVANPLTYWAVQAGHPEEVLGAALCCGAVLAAERRRRLAAAVLLGLAIGTKPWAVLAVPPVGLALAPGLRLRALLTAGAVAALLVLPAPLMSFSAYHASTSAVTLSRYVSPRSLWWAAGARRPAQGRAEAAAVLPAGMDRGDSLLVLASCAGLLAAAWARRRADPDDAVRVLTAIMLLRLLLDPLALPYYALPLLLALACLSARTAGRELAAPVAVTGLLLAERLHAPGVVFAATVLWAVPVAGMLATGRGARLGRPKPGRLATAAR